MSVSARPAVRANAGVARTPSRVARLAMRTVLVLVLVAGCKPGITAADELCARAAAIYDRCESHDGTTAQQWELTIDRWRGLCRAALTGQTKQLLPDGLAIWNDMADDVRAGVKLTAECTAAATTCEQYAACNK